MPEISVRAPHTCSYSAMLWTGGIGPVMGPLSVMPPTNHAAESGPGGLVGPVRSAVVMTTPTGMSGLLIYQDGLGVVRPGRFVLGALLRRRHRALVQQHAGLQQPRREVVFHLGVHEALRRRLVALGVVDQRAWAW